MSWSKEQVSVLIEEFMKYPCLYAVKTKAYVNKHLRKDALEKIEASLKTVRPTTTITEIKNKFMGLKNTFLTEHRKYTSSLHSGQEDESVYRPNLWYYDKLLFILDHVEPRKSYDSFNATQTMEVSQPNRDTEEEWLLENTEHSSTASENSQITEEYFVHDNGVHPIDDMGDSPKNTDLITVPSTSSSIYKTANAPVKRKRKMTDTERTDDTNGSNSIIQETSMTLKPLNENLMHRNASKENVCNEDDRAYANYIISRLKKITRDDIRLEVEEEINKCIFTGIKRCMKQ